MNIISRATRKTRKSGKSGGIFRRFTHSMYVRLLVIMIVLTVIPVIAVQVFYTRYFIDLVRNNRGDIARNYAAVLADELLESGYLDGTPSDTIDAELMQFAHMYNGRVIVEDASFIVRADTHGMITGRQLVSEDAVLAMQNTEVSVYSPSTDMLRLTYVIHNPADDSVSGLLLMYLSCADLTESYHSVARSMMIIMSIFSLVLIILSFIISHSFTKPFNTMASTINRISEGKFDQEVSLKGFTEVEQISDAFNRMLSRLNELESSRQEFVSNVSHELKTPLTSMKILADSLNMQPDAPVELYRDFMQDITSEIDRENTIISDLLALVKMDKTDDDLHITSVSINEMLELIRKRLKPIAARRDVAIHLDTEGEVKAECDEVKLSLAISNLVENAIKYNIAGGWVNLSLSSDDKYCYITVTDSGIGIPQESQEKIFERFYRVDKARSRESGGTGLGLAITKNIIMMHNGSIVVASKEDEGSKFSIRLPLRHEHPEEVKA